jgi:hypothetical protein
LTQLSKIQNEIQNDTWIEQKLVIAFEVNDESNDKIQIQYRDIIEIIKFLINHFFFRVDLAYALVRQFNDNDEKVYIEMHTEDWWWKKQIEVFEKTTIVFLLIANDKIMLFQHQKNRAMWLVYLTIENLSREVRRSQTRSNDLFLRFISHAHYSSRDRMKTKVWHEILSFMLERTLFNIQFKMTRILTLIYYQSLRSARDKTTFWCVVLMSKLEDACSLLSNSYVIMRSRL